MKTIANGLEIEYEDSASINPEDPHLQCRPVVLLIMGLGMQLIDWPEAWVQELVDAGYRVIRFDNRDSGLSMCLDELGKPNLLLAGMKAKMGLQLHPPYTLRDMATDALGLLDALGIQRAHVVGVSLGGMVAQWLALLAPDRVLSLTSIMSSSGAPGLPAARPEVLKVLWSPPKYASLDALVDYGVAMYQAIGSPAYPTPQAELRERVQRHMARSYQPMGTLRQALAVMADVGRAELLRQIRVPTLVLHGKEDPFIPYACGEDTAQRIPGACMVGIEGMGHDMPAPVVEQLLLELVRHLHAVDERTV